MEKKYSMENFKKDSMASAIGLSLPISSKQSIEICSFIRDMSLIKAREALMDVLKHKKAVPFTRFNGDVGHKKKIGPGRFPQKASTEFIKLLDNVEANAQFKGLNTSNLIIMHICANRASTPLHQGRQRRRKMKRTNVEIIVEERSSKKKEPETKDPKVQKKIEEKPKEVKIKK